jgi:hypothetical protein
MLFPSDIAFLPIITCKTTSFGEARSSPWSGQEERQCAGDTIGHMILRLRACRWLRAVRLCRMWLVGPPAVLPDSVRFPRDMMLSA